MARNKPLTVTLSDTYVEGLTLQPLLKEPETEKTAPARHRWYDYDTEILDQQEGWVYEKLPKNKKGKKLRKFFESLYNDYSSHEAPLFWRPKVKDLIATEAKRWNALKYRKNQYAKITGAFDLVLNNTPFCCIRNTSEWPGFAWVEFPHYENTYPGEPRGISWDWWKNSYRNKQKTDKPDSPIRQDIGDAWFHYEQRSREISQRVGYFEKLFDLALRETKYAKAFYTNRKARDIKIKLVINGREYIIGEKDREGFGVLIYPEELITVNYK